ncbi:MAG: TonB-dependent receptor, partial [Terracidiphilus sp.]
MRNLITRSLIRRLSLVAFFMFFAALTRAQDTSSITGVVTDSTGAVIPGVVVTLSNPSTGATFTAKTDNSGSYRFSDIPPSSGYKETFTRDGFSSVAISGVTLSVGITRTQNARMAPGTNVETVQVSAGGEAVTLDTSDASIGNNMSIEQLNQLPVYDRSTGINTLFVQQPGVDSFQGAVTGARIDQSEVTVDGLDVDDLATGQTFYLTSPAPVDSVEQFTGTVAGLTPGAGTGSGGQFQLVTKTGTNSFHGNVNEYHRDTTTVSNTWFNNLIGLPRTPLIRNQFGANIGGPIKRDKLFFFFDWADSRIVQSSTTERTVPLDEFRNGTFDYINSDAGCGDSSRLDTQPGCITNLSGTKFASYDPAGTGFDTSELSYITARYPHVNDTSQGDGVNTGGYRFTTPAPDNRSTYVTRVDYTMTPTQRVYGRFTITDRNAISVLPEFPTDPLTHPEYDRTYGYVVSHVWQIGSNKVNQVYYGDNISKLNFPDLYNPNGQNQYSFTGFDGPFTSFDGQKRRIPIPVVRDDFSWQHGAHNFSIGGTFKFIKTNSNLISDFNYPEVGLTGSLSGGLGTENAGNTLRPTDINQGPNEVGTYDYDNLYASALGVLPEIYTNFSYNNKGAALTAGSGTPRAYRHYETEAYFGDVWKVSPKLTLNYGVRYQFYSVPYETHGFESVPTQIPLNT